MPPIDGDDLDEIEIEMEEEGADDDEQNGAPEADDDAARPAKKKADEDEGGEDDDVDEYGRKVQKRIRKERRKRGEVERKLTAAERELQELRAWREQIERERAQSYANEAESSVSRTQQALRRAIENGDTDKQVELQEQLAEQRMRAQQAKQYSQQQPAPRNQLAERWKADNADWYGDPEYAAETAATNAIDQQLAREGYDPNSPQYFKELDRRITERFSYLAVEDDDQEQGRQAPSRPKQQPVAGATRQPPSGKRSVKLTKDDVAAARMMGLDLSDPAVKREYARQVAASRRQA